MKTIHYLRNMGAVVFCLIPLLFVTCAKEADKLLSEELMPEEEDFIDPNEPGIPDVYVEGAKLLTLGNPDNFTVNYGMLSFGARPFHEAGPVTTNLNFLPRALKATNDGYYLYGIGSGPRVQRAFTEDGYTFSDNTILYNLPASPSGTPWVTTQLATKDDDLLLMAIAAGQPARQGHYFYAFGTNNSDTNWSLLQSTPLYKGQDALHIAWNEPLQQFVNYQTTYQLYDKRYPDNVSPTRRVLHIRTSPDGVNWTPGDSFGVDGPYLSEDQLILPDNQDSEDTEFYKFAAIDLDEFWAGIMVKYVSKPQEFPNTSPWPHGSFLSYEWWISNDGIEWNRPFRNSSRLDNAPYELAYRFMQPMKIENELRWVAENRVYTLNRYRIFYTYSRANAEILTKPLQLRVDTPIALMVDFFDRSIDYSPNLGDALNQGYIMAELVDQAGQVIPGFERGKCTFQASEERKLTLKWDNKSLPDNLDNPVQLRIFFRDARLYSVMY